MGISHMYPCLKQESLRMHYPAIATWHWLEYYGPG